MATLDQRYVADIRDRGLSEPERRADLSDEMLRIHNQSVDKQDHFRELLEARIDGSSVDLRNESIRALEDARAALLDGRQRFDEWVAEVERFLAEADDA